jgi:hypothetical protein
LLWARRGGARPGGRHPAHDGTAVSRSVIRSARYAPATPK